MTYTTPTPPGTPDYSGDLSQRATVILNETFSTSGTTASAWLYVGNVASIFLYATASGASTLATVRLFWNTMTSGASLFQTEDYVINPNSGVVICDGVPVVAPYVLVQIIAQDGAHLSLAVIMTTLGQTRRSTPALQQGGTCISATTTVAHGVTTNIFGQYVSPGLYSFYVSNTLTNAGVTVTLAGWLNGTLSDIWEQWAGAATNAIFAGDIVVGTIQPTFTISNGGAAASTVWTTVLIGPQVT